MIEQLKKDFEAGMTYDQLCEKYCWAFGKVKRVLRENGVDTSSRDRKKYRTEKTISQQEKENIVDKYVNRGHSLNSLTRDTGIGKEKIRKILVDSGAEIRSTSNKKYRLNDCYFDTIGSNQAYILGFFAADGYVKKNSNFMKLTLATKDAEILERMREEIELDKEIHYFTTSDGWEKASLEFSSQKIKRIFEYYGVIPNKTFQMHSLPRIPNEFLADYIRGYSDGDGSVSSKNPYWNITSGSKGILSDIVIWLNQEHGIPTTKLRFDPRGNGCWAFSYTGRKVLRDIYPILYHDEKTLSLKRKHESFKSIVK